MMNDSRLTIRLDMDAMLAICTDADGIPIAHHFHPDHTSLAALRDVSDGSAFPMMDFVSALFGLSQTSSLADLRPGKD